MWTNTTDIIEENLSKEKPCHKLGWCPYGAIVEEFSLMDETVKNVKLNCKVFGHHCPMFYNAEDTKEGE